MASLRPRESKIPNYSSGLTLTPEPGTVNLWEGMQSLLLFDQKLADRAVRAGRPGVLKIQRTHGI